LHRGGGAAGRLPAGDRQVGSIEGTGAPSCIRQSCVFGGITVGSERRCSCDHQTNRHERLFLGAASQPPPDGIKRHSEFSVGTSTKLEPEPVGTARSELVISRSPPSGNLTFTGIRTRSSI
jgi:hypothetical protein